jgi:hypothetical protein
MADTVKMTVADGWAVFHDGEHRTGGTVVEFDQATANHWLERGWARLADKPTTRRRTTTLK